MRRNGWFHRGMGVRTAAVAAAALLGASLAATRAEAIPAWSREYKTECTTCHTIFPQLNEFGQAFEKNAFVWPGMSKKKVSTAQTEEERKSAEFIKLSGIPASIPVSFLTSVSYQFNEDAEDSFDMKRFSAQILTGGAFGGDKFGFWFHESLGSQSTTATNSLTGPSNLYIVARHPLGVPMHLKAGKYSPDTSLWKASLNGSLLSSGYTAAGLSISSAQNALEASTILASRIQAVVGMNDRNNAPAGAPVHSVNDFYGSIKGKIGGVDFLGKEPDVDLEKDSVWDYLSISGNVFAYTGSQSFGNGVDRDLHRYGVEAEAAYKKVLLMAGYSTGTNLKDTPTEVDSRAYSAEVDYVFSPKYAVALRYDHLEVDKLEDRNVISPALIYAPLQSVRFRLSYASDSNPTGAPEGKAVTSKVATLSATMSF